MNSFFKRTITGTLFVVVLSGAILWHPLSFFILFLIINILALRELYLMALASKSHPQKYYGSIIGAMVFISGFLWYNFSYGAFLSLILIPAFSFILIFELYRDLKHPLLNVSTTVFGIFYISLPLMLLNHIVYLTGEYSGKILLFIFILIWASDTGAYLLGVTFGKHRLFERISPKKSWEGFFGGLIVSQLAAFFIAKYSGTLVFIHWGVIAAIIAVFGTLGDLVESMIKRSIGIKDSGRLLPGHGGVLDRFDSLVFTIPLIFTYLYIFIK